MRTADDDVETQTAVHVLQLKREERLCLPRATGLIYTTPVFALMQRKGVNLNF